ncbi:unnamed protein product [Moneuplotes crassus]|uniref:Uncharacterized protein n=1 Tax=Euplotes crassus TaxID=5936 RepID=A0AAD1U7A8_EUPCR|nr:unnamed protein product [Moneuplotes crassus]
MTILSEKLQKNKNTEQSNFKHKLKRFRNKAIHKCKFSTELASPRKNEFEQENDKLKAQISQLKETLTKIRKDYIKEIMQYESRSDPKNHIREAKSSLSQPNRYIDINDLIDEDSKKILSHKISEIKSQCDKSINDHLKYERTLIQQIVKLKNSENAYERLTKIPKEEVEKVYSAILKNPTGIPVAQSANQDRNIASDEPNSPTSHQVLGKVHQEMQEKFKNLKDYYEKEIKALRKELDEAKWKYDTEKSKWENQAEESTKEAMKLFQKEEKEVLQSLLDKSSEDPEGIDLTEILKQELKCAKYDLAVEKETHRLHNLQLEENKSKLTMKEEEHNRFKEEVRFNEKENVHLKQYKEEAESIINNLSKKIVKLENDLAYVKGDPSSIDINTFLDGMGLNSQQNPASDLANNSPLDVSFIQREASIKCIEKIQRIKRRFHNQGCITDMKDINKHLVAIEEKEYQEYRKDKKLRKESPVRTPSSSMSESGSSNDSIIKLRRMEMSNLLLKRKMTKVIQDIPMITKGTMTEKIFANEDLDRRSERSHSTKKIIELTKRNNSNYEEDSEIDEKYLKPISDRKSIEERESKDRKDESKINKSIGDSFETIKNVPENQDQPNLSVHIIKNKLSNNEVIKEGILEHPSKIHAGSQAIARDTMIKLPTEHFTEHNDSADFPKIILKQSYICKECRKIETKRSLSENEAKSVRNSYKNLLFDTQGESIGIQVGKPYFIKIQERMMKKGREMLQRHRENLEMRSTKGFKHINQNSRNIHDLPTSLTDNLKGLSLTGLRYNDQPLDKLMTFNKPLTYGNNDDLNLSEGKDSSNPSRQEPNKSFHKGQCCT